MQTDDLAFLGALAAEGNSTWRSIVNLDGTNVNFKLDTGAEVTAITENTYKQLHSRRRLQKPSRVLYGSASQSLKVIGQFTGELCASDCSHREPIFIVRGLKNNLLGLPALPTNIRKEFPKVYTGLGNFGEPYDIQLKEDAKPRALFTLRNIAIPLWDKVKKELGCMETLGVISKVTEPTHGAPEWWSCLNAPVMSAFVWILKHSTKV